MLYTQGHAWLYSARARDSRVQSYKEQGLGLLVVETCS